MTGQLGKRGMLGAMMAALAGMSASVAAANAATQVPNVGFQRHGIGRSRTPGKPGRAGDKLRRMAGEGRIGLGFQK